MLSVEILCPFPYSLLFFLVLTVALAFKNVYFIVCVRVFACEYVCASCNAVLVEATRGRWIPWNWSYAQLGATMRVLGK